MSRGTGHAERELKEIIDRILKLSISDEVNKTLPSFDVEAIQLLSSEALLALSHNPESSVAAAQICSLAVECVGIVEHAEMTTCLASLVAAGCEVLATMLSKSGVAGCDDSDWVTWTLEQLSDQLDFLALEVFCGISRLDGVTLDAMPPTSVGEDFDQYWGSLEHRNALQTLSVWMLTLVFRAIGKDAVTSRRLMEWANNDLLCLSAFLRGFLGAPDLAAEGLPEDIEELEAVALEALLGLTSPELAFASCAEEGGNDVSIEQRNAALELHIEVLCAAFAEARLLPAVLMVLRRPGCASRWLVPLLEFLAKLLRNSPVDDSAAQHPAVRLRTQLRSEADQIGSLLDSEYPSVNGNGGGETKDLPQQRLLEDCAVIAAALTATTPETTMLSPSSLELDDGFVLWCRAFVEQSIDGATEDITETKVIALVALASNVNDLQVVRPRLKNLVDRMKPEARARAWKRLAQCGSLPLCDKSALELFQSENAVICTDAQLEVVSISSPVAEKAPVPAVPSRPPGLRDLIQNAPEGYRCGIDQKILCDPVQTPHGAIFERGTLLQWLQTNGNTCPVSGEPLGIDDCVRLPELRKEITQWVRGGQDGKAKPKKARPKPNAHA